MNQLWNDCDMESQTPATGVAGHPFGMYFQATARQIGHSASDRLERLRKATHFFEVDVAESKALNLLSFLAACVRLRESAEKDDVGAWTSTKRSLGQYMRGSPQRGFTAHYKCVWGQLGRFPSLDHAEAYWRRCLISDGRSSLRL